MSLPTVLLQGQILQYEHISDELNLSSQSSFGKFFRKHTGLTPREYRKSGNDMDMGAEKLSGMERKLATS
ncbi:MAG: helix-turn-helix domain-containing protein [Prevotellaceae bacterium]|jgi:AraC-like DNA-binding protein|nr:helix-turn-helix domain-containing protein [Prevotellaceae bacterium]